MKQSIRKFVALVLLLLFAGFYAGTTLFVHSHLINGEQIVHSHPIFGGDDSAHSHSQAEIDLITHLTTFSILFAATLILSGFVCAYVATIWVRNVHWSDGDEECFASLRAPPATALLA